MKRQTYLPLLCLWLISAGALFSAPIQNLKFTDVVKDVKILNVATKAETTAKVGDVLVPPNVIKTGADSRAELVAEDQTVTRVGANTIFSVEANSRDVNIAKGSVLFHSPAGKGGGNIKSAGATASVLGTTLIVGANQAGGFKVMLLEGKGQVSGAGGGGTKLTAGQMSFAMPGQAPSQPLNFELKGQVSGSKLVGGFSKPLASIAKIEAAVNVQQSKIASGEMASTGLMIGDSPSVAFKVDSAVVRVNAETVEKAKAAVVRARVAQAKTEAAKIERTRQILDPRFLAAVSKTLTLTTATTPPSHEAPIPMTLEKLIAGSSSATTGNFTIGDDSGWGAPIGIPGNREEQKPVPLGDLTLLLARNVTFNITPSTDEAPAIFAIAPFYPGKNYNGLVALEDINFNKSVDFVERMVESQGSVSDPLVVVENLFLSAGRTITAGAGTVIKSSHAVNFDIYAGGTGFSGANDRLGFFAPSGGNSTPLTLSDSMVWNALNWTLLPDEDNPDGSLRIEAPGMTFNNLTISAGRTSGASIDLKSTGPIVLSVDATKLDLVKSYDVAPDSDKASIISTARAQNIPLPLGFSGPEALAIQAFNVRITSTGKPISINGVPIYANNISVSSGSVPLAATETDARVFTATNNSTDFANKLYVPIAKYDLDQNGVISDAELAAAVGLLVSKSVSGANVPAGTTIQGVSRAVSVPSNAAEADAQSLSNMLELVLSGTVAFSGVDKEGSVTGTTSVVGKFKTGTITIGQTSADFPEGTIAISNIRTEGVNLGGNSPVDLKIKIEATGDLELRNNEFELMTHVDLRAKQAALLENNLFASDAELNVWAHEDVTFSGVSVNTASTGGGALNPKVSVESNSKSVYVNTGRNEFVTLKAAGLHTAPTTTTRTVFKATAVSFTADNGDVVIHNTNFATGSEADTQFAARAKDHVAIYNSNIDHSKVLIAANTVVLKDVDFSYGSAVDLRSGRGLVAGNPGSGAAVLPGHVNFVSNVKYGPYGIDGLAAHGMANPGGDAAFRSAMNLRHANTTPGVTPDFTKLTIKDLTGATK